MRLVTTAEILDLLGTEPDEPDEPDGPDGPEYAPATSADIVSVAARRGWFSDDRYLSPAVPAAPPPPLHAPDARAFGSLRSP
jgi:hypothetical protein